MAILKALPGSAKVNGKPVKGRLIQIKRSVINIDKFLSKRNAANKKQQEILRKQNQNFKRKNKEVKLEKPKQEWKKIIPKKVPGLSFFDSIRKFVVGWILGFVAIKLIPLLPKLIPVVLQLGKVVNWFINIGGAFLNGIISFIDFGVRAQEKTYGFIKSIGGEGVANALAGFAKAFGTALDVMLVVGGMTLAEGMSGDSGLGSLFGGGPKPKGPANNIRKFSRTRSLSKTATKTATKTGGRFGRSALTNLGRKSLVRVLGKGGTRNFLRLIKNFISPNIKAIPLIGGLLDFAINVFVFKESPGKSAFKAIGAGLGAWLVGALASIVPGLGTFLGAVIGGFAGDALGGLIYDMVFDGKDNTSKRPEDPKDKDKDKDKGVVGSTITGGTAGLLKKRTTTSASKKLRKPKTPSGVRKNKFVEFLNQKKTEIKQSSKKIVKTVKSKASKIKLATTRATTRATTALKKKVIKPATTAITKNVVKPATTAITKNVIKPVLATTKTATAAVKPVVKTVASATKAATKSVTTAGKVGLKAVSGTLKAAKKIISPIVKKIPLLGPIVDFLLNVFVFKEPLGRSAFMAIGAGLGAWVGGALGTLIPVPGVGTAIGAFLGGVGGDMLGGAIYDGIFGGKEVGGKKEEVKKDKKIKKDNLVPPTSRVTTYSSVETNRESEMSMLMSGERGKIEQALYQMRAKQNLGSGEGYSDFVGNPEYEAETLKWLNRKDGEPISTSGGIEEPSLKIGKQPVKFDEELLGISASYESDGSQKEYTIYAPTTQINMLPVDNSDQLVTSGATAYSGDDPYEVLEKGV